MFNQLFAEKLQLWFNPKRNFYEAYAPNGECINNIKVSVEDDLYGHVEATIKLSPKIVNEKPKRKNYERQALDFAKYFDLQFERYSYDEETKEQLYSLKTDTDKRNIYNIEGIYKKWEESQK